MSTNRIMINKLDRLVYTNRIHKLGTLTVAYSSKRAVLSKVVADNGLKRCRYEEVLLGKS